MAARRLRHVSIGALVAGLALVLAAVLAASGRASDPNVTFTATDTLDPVTAGLTMELVFDIQNPGNATLTHAKVGYPLPTGAAIVSATPSQGTCKTLATGALCDLGKVSGGKTASVTIRITAPPASFDSCATFGFKESKHDTDSSHLDTLEACQSTRVRAANDPNFRGGCIAAGETVATGTQATATDRQNTAITTPGGACVSVSEVAATGPTDSCGAGFTCKTDVSEIVHPPCSASAPCKIVVTFDSSFGEIRKLFYNGVKVEPCTTPGVASPDPCILSKTLVSSSVRSVQTGAKDTTFVVLSAIDARLRGG